MTKGTLINRIGRPYRVVEGKGARFIKYSDAYVEMPTPIYKDISYPIYEKRLISRTRLVEDKERMICHTYTVRNKSRGVTKKIRHIEATIEAYYIVGYPEWKIYKKLEDIVSKTDFAFIMDNFNVEGEEKEDLPFDSETVDTYSFVLMDYDYKCVRHRESGSL